jgi:formate hydrogenlyase subunit 4
LLVERVEEDQMRWMGVYLIGYILLVAALLLALWKTGVLASIGAFWIGVGLLFLIGLGIIFAVANSGRKENITVDRG